MKNILILNGPNLNLLGQRDPSIYGQFTLEDIGKKCREYAEEFDSNVHFFQSNHEGELIDQIQMAQQSCDGIIINAGGYSHTSVAIRDALADSPLPIIEVHISNLSARESFRHESLISPIANGVLFGFGAKGYLLAIYSLLHE